MQKRLGEVNAGAYNARMAQAHPDTQRSQDAGQAWLFMQEWAMA